MKSKRVKPEELFFSKTWEFLNDYMPEKLNRSPETIASYRDSLSIFRRFVTGKLNRSLMDFKFSDCTRDCIFDFRDHLKESGCAPSTINIRVTAIHSYLSYAADGDISLQSIALVVGSIPPLKVPKKELPVISDAALSAMFSSVDPTRIGIRDQAFMVLLYDSAIRLDEILSLRLKDINLDGEYPCILLHGKGNKERRAVISDKTADHIRNYISIYHKTSDKEDFLFFTTIKGVKGKMSHGNGQRIINKYADRARAKGVDLPEKVHPHMFRRTKATALYQSGVALEMVSTLLGHAQLETTKSHYAKPSDAQMREAMERVQSPASDETPLWSTDEETLAKLAGLR